MPAHKTDLRFVSVSVYVCVCASLCYAKQYVTHAHTHAHVPNRQSIQCVYNVYDFVMAARSYSAKSVVAHNVFACFGVCYLYFGRLQFVFLLQCFIHIRFALV